MKAHAVHAFAATVVGEKFCQPRTIYWFVLILACSCRFQLLNLFQLSNCCFYNLPVNLNNLIWTHPIPRSSIKPPKCIEQYAIFLRGFGHTSHFCREAPMKLECFHCGMGNHDAVVRDACEGDLRHRTIAVLALHTFAVFVCYMHRSYFSETILEFLCFDILIYL